MSTPCKREEELSGRGKRLEGKCPDPSCPSSTKGGGYDLGSLVRGGLVSLTLTRAIRETRNNEKYVETHFTMHRMKPAKETAMEKVVTRKLPIKQKHLEPFAM